MVFRKSDLVSVLILGEIVALFGVAILITQGIALPVSITVLAAALIVAAPAAAAVLLYVTYLLGEKVKPVFFQIGKFAAVGVSNTAIDWGVLNLLLLLLSGSLKAASVSASVYAVLKALSFLSATLNSFFWNKFWSFRERGTRRIGSEAARFYAVTIVGLVINVALATAIKAAGPDTRLWAGIAAPAIATVASLVWNFVGYKFIVFVLPAARPPQPNTAPPRAV